MAEFFLGTPLKDDELQQLQALLIRYLHNHALGLANMAIDGVLRALDRNLGRVGQRQQQRLIEYSSEELLLLLG